MTQIVLVTGGGIEQNITIDGNHTTVNVSDLLPGNEYVFRIIAVASDGQTSPISAALIASTRSRVSGTYVSWSQVFLPYVYACMWQGTFTTLPSPQGYSMPIIVFL